MAIRALELGAQSSTPASPASGRRKLFLNANGDLCYVTSSGTVELVGSDAYASAVGDTVLSTPVGGASAQTASVWKTRTLSQALDVILFPTVLPTITTQRSVSLGISGSSGVLEVGSTFDRTLTATFDRGRITNGDGSLGPLLVGAATSTVFSGPGISGSSSGTLFSAVPVQLGANSWSVVVQYAAGSGEYFDNKGNVSTALNSSRVAGSVSGSISPVQGVYPWFFVKSPVSFTAAQLAAAITALGNSTSGTASNIHSSATISRVVADASGTIAVPYNVNNQFLGVAYDSDLTTKTRYFVTSLDTGAITGVFNAVVTQNDVAQAASAPRWTRNFKVHISTNPLTNSNSTIELRNS